MKSAPRILRTYVSIALLVLLAVTLSIFIPIPSTLTTVGKVFNAREWCVMRDAAGRIATVVNDRLGNVAESMMVHQNERDDAVVVALSPKVRQCGNVVMGDTIGRMSSAEADRQLAELEGELARADAMVQVYREGEKLEVQREAEQRLAQAKTEFDGYQRTVQRMKLLVDRGIISQQEFETVENNGNRYQAEVRVAEAALQSAKTGSKPSQQVYGEKGRESMVEQIRALKRKLDRYVFIAPFSGTVLRSSLSDTLVRIGADGPFTVLMAVPWSKRLRVHVGQQVRVSITELGTSSTARIAMIGNTVLPLGGEQVVLVTAILHDVPQDLLPGVAVECSIEEGNVTLWNAATRFIKETFVL